MEYVRFGELYKIPSCNGLSRPSAVRGEGYKMVNMGELFSNDIINDMYMERVQMNEREQKKFLLEKGDLLLIQNEISSLTYLITKAHEKGLRIAFNTAPMDEKIFGYPLDLIDIFVVNEVEGKGLANVSSDQIEDVIAGLQKAYPSKEIILTVGSQGSYYISGDMVIHQDAYRVEAVDTTAAGDTFTGFYLASILRGEMVSNALRIAAKASSITVTKEGAAKSIPTLEQVVESMKNV